MASGTKGVSIAVLTAVVLASAACGGSTKKAAAPSPSPASSAAPSTSAAPATSAPSDPPAASSGGALTTDKISSLLLTGKDEAGYTFDAASDSKTVTSTQDVVATGGAVCQTFVDAEEALAPKYGTTAEVDRQLTKTNDSHTIESSVVEFPSAAQAAAMIADLTTGLKGCRSLSLSQAGVALTMQPSTIPELTKAGQAGYVDTMAAGGKSELMAADLVQVGTTVSVVAIVGPPSNDPAALRQMGATQLARLSDVQVGRLKTAQGLS